MKNLLYSFAFAALATAAAPGVAEAQVVSRKEPNVAEKAGRVILDEIELRQQRRRENGGEHDRSPRTSPTSTSRKSPAPTTSPRRKSPTTHRDTPQRTQRRDYPQRDEQRRSDRTRRSDDRYESQRGHRRGHDDRYDSPRDYRSASKAQCGVPGCTHPGKHKGLHKRS